MTFKKKRTHSRKRRTYKKSKKRRNPAVSLMGNPRRRTYRRRYRRNPGFGKINIVNTLTTGAVAAVGAGGAMIITNMINKMIQGTGKTISVPMKNFITLGVAVGLSAIMPKLKLGKYSEAAATGALAISIMNIASTSFGLSKFFSLSGEDNPELDKIISNLNVSGQDTDLLGISEDYNLLGVDLLGISEEDNQLLGLAETLMGDEDEDDEL